MGLAQTIGVNIGGNAGVGLKGAVSARVDSSVFYPARLEDPPGRGGGRSSGRGGGLGLPGRGPGDEVVVEAEV